MLYEECWHFEQHGVQRLHDSALPDPHHPERRLHTVAKRLGNSSHAGRGGGQAPHGEVRQGGSQADGQRARDADVHWWLWNRRKEAALSLSWTIVYFYRS